MTELYAEVGRLTTGHCGFLSGKKANCGIFRQDKWRYLQDLGSDMTERTIMIPLDEEVEVQPTGAGPHSFAAQIPTIAEYIIK